MLCINPFCCPLKECLLEHHDQRLISPTLTVCEDFPRCHNLDCALYHPRRIAMTVHADKDCRAWACPMLHRSRKCFRPACDCPGIHRPTSPSPLNTLCESLLFSIAEFLVLPDALALYAASHAIHQNRRAALIPRDIRFFRRRKSIFWEPVRKVVHQRVHASYPRKKKSVCVVVECGEYVHHRFEVSSIHEWTQHFSRDVQRPRSQTMRLRTVSGTRPSSSA
ncbi:hypothetical protein EBZ80_04995 [bacterium]|nr:hypothetical protein [bacterium]